MRESALTGFGPLTSRPRSQRLFDAHLANADQALLVAEVDGDVVGLVRVQALGTG